MWVIIPTPSDGLVSLGGFIIAAIIITSCLCLSFLVTSALYDLKFCRYTTTVESYMPSIRACLKDEVPLVRKQTLISITRLLKVQCLKCGKQYSYRHWSKNTLMVSFYNKRGRHKRFDFLSNNTLTVSSKYIRFWLMNILDW